MEGQFVKEEYSDHMKANYRYYKWISEDDDSHFIYVNFKENESGVYTVSAYNTSGFSGTGSHRKVSGHREGRGRRGEQGSVCKRRDEGLLRGDRPVCKDDVKVKIMTKIPVSGWSFDDRGAAWWKTTIPRRLAQAPSGSR